MAATRKKPIPGSIQPRWPKPRVVRWLEVGAVPALVGLWLPDWVGGYAGAAAAPALRLPPVLAFAGAVILLKACLEGVKHMGSHYRGVKVAGALAVAAAAASVALTFVDSPAGRAATLAAVFLAALFSTAFLWFTVDKVAEITTERRTEVTARALAAAGLAAVPLAGMAAWLALDGGSAWVPWARATQVAFSLAFVLGRYGVHCYKTQRSIGATFSAEPAEQFWV